MVGEQRPARRRHERREPLQQLQRLEEQRGGAVAPRTSEVVEQLATRARGQPRQRQRRTHEVADQVFEAIAPARRHGHVRMQTEALEPRRAPPGRRRGGGRAKPAERLTGPQAERHPALQRRRHGAGEQRRLRRERVAPRVLLRQPAAESQESADAAVEPRQQ